MNEAVYHRLLFYDLCSKRSPRIGAALGSTFSLVPRQAAEFCEITRSGVIVETWPPLTREEIWNPSLIPFTIELEPIMELRSCDEPLSVESLAFYAILKCTLTFGQYATSGRFS